MPSRPIGEITGITVEGFKSLHDRTHVAIRPLTVLAGVNSSGKSSLMQPLLLLKQTADATIDRGPLRLDGPNVRLTRLDQILSRGVDGAPDADSFGIGLTIDGRETTWSFDRGSNDHIRLYEMAGWFSPDQHEPITIRADMEGSELAALLPSDLTEDLRRDRGEADGVGWPDQFVVARFGYRLAPAIRLSRNRTATQSRGLDLVPFEQAIADVVHVPAGRANPERSYPVAAVEGTYPGTFDGYTAGIIAAWQARGAEEALARLQSDLAELRLTSSIRAQQLSDAEIELLVGRLPDSRSDADLVNVPDVGFGVSQTLPVVVALLTAHPGQLVYLEAPEIHLHPAAQWTFGNLVKRAIDRGVTVVVETHSALFLQAVQTHVARGAINPDDVALHWFTRDSRSGYTEVHTAELADDGSFGDWPEDFYDVHLRAEGAYLDATSRWEGTL